MIQMIAGNRRHWAIVTNARLKSSVPLMDEVLQLLAEHRLEQIEGYPYVFVPAYR